MTEAPASGHLTSAAEQPMSHASRSTSVQGRGALSFRDPAGTLQVDGAWARRTVRPAYAAEILEFLATPLAARLADSGRLISSTVLDRPGSDGGPLVLLHPKIQFPSYPWEWPPALWEAAAALTLDLCGELLAEGWILKDATPLNVLFRGSHPIHVDLLSVARLDPEIPLWFAQAQFVRSFVLPMLANARRGWPLSGMLQRRDGYLPEELYESLGWPARLSRPALGLVTLPALLDRIFASRLALSPMRPKSEPAITKAILTRGLTRLRRSLQRATPKRGESSWSGYVAGAVHYDAADAERKIQVVREMLARTAATRVLDAGCNTGEFSVLAAHAGAEVVAIDRDEVCVERLARRAQDEDLDILPLIVDLSRPTPAAGWQNAESASFLERAEGYFDLVMMLAVIHHLLLQAQVPLDLIASLSHQLTRRHLMIEWVPQTDPKFRELLRGREAIYAHLTEAAFVAAFDPYFSVESTVVLGNGRAIYLMARR